MTQPLPPPLPWPPPLPPTLRLPLQTPLLLFLPFPCRLMFHVPCKLAACIRILPHLSHSHPSPALVPRHVGSILSHMFSLVDIEAPAPPLRSRHAAKAKAAKRCRASNTATAAPVARRARLKSSSSNGRRIISYASDCSGVDSGAVALSTMGAEMRHLWASDVSLSCRRMLAHNFDITTIYKDVFDKFRSGENSGPVPDLYCSGPPCQPFSAMGQQQGIADNRSLVFFGVTRTISETMPKTFVIENVPQIATSQKHKSLWAAIISLLTGICDENGNRAYNLYYKELNALWHGVPQSRRRCYLVGVLRSAQVSPFRWPAATTVPALGPCLARLAPVLPTSRQQLRNILRGAQFIRAHGGDPANEEWVGRISQSDRWAVSAVLDHCPTITRSHPHAIWLYNRGRNITTDELGVLQGFPVGHLSLPEKVSIRQLASMYGNAFCVTVMRRIFCRLLACIGAAEFKDPWGEGSIEANCL